MSRDPKTFFLGFFFNLEWFLNLSCYVFQDVLQSSRNWIKSYHGVDGADQEGATCKHIWYMNQPNHQSVLNCSVPHHLWCDWLHLQIFTIKMAQFSRHTVLPQLGCIPVFPLIKGPLPTRAPKNPKMKKRSLVDWHREIGTHHDTPKYRTIP